MKLRRKIWKHGDVRVVKRFALFPMYIGEEGRWLQWVRVKQTFNKSFFNSDWWSNSEFLEI